MNGVRILLVDDEPLIAETLAAILTDRGYHCMVSYTGEDAVRQSQEFQPNLVISDVIMPGMSGIETAIRIRAMFPGCQILLLSGQASTADLLEAARQQGQHFELLPKPIHPQDLLARIERVQGTAS